MTLFYYDSYFRASILYATEPSGRARSNTEETEEEDVSIDDDEEAMMVCTEKQ